MSYIDRHHPAPFGAVTSDRATDAISELASPLRRMVAAVREWDSRRRTVAELGRLTDRQLADIGLLRAHVEDLRRGRPLI